MVDFASPKPLVHLVQNIYLYAHQDVHLHLYTKRQTGPYTWYMYMFSRVLQNQNSPIDSPTAPKQWTVNHQPITKNMEAHFCQYREENVLICYIKSCYRSWYCWQSGFAITVNEFHLIEGEILLLYNYFELQTFQGVKVMKIRMNSILKYLDIIKKKGKHFHKNPIKPFFQWELYEYTFLTEMGFLREAETVQKHAAKTLAITPSQKPATSLSHCPLTSPDRTVTGERKASCLEWHYQTSSATPFSQWIVTSSCKKLARTMLHYFSMQYWAITQRHLWVCSPAGLMELTGEILHALLDWEEERGAGIWKLPPQLASHVGFSYTIPAPVV